MRDIQSIQLFKDSNEEKLPGFSPDFPYIASKAILNRYTEQVVPWHWHRNVELFYIESGTLEYITPSGTWRFPAGSGGFLNSNILHSSKVISFECETVQLLHLFEPELLSGIEQIDEKYIRPLTTAFNVEMIPLSPEIPVQAAILKKIRAAFDLDESAWGYEFMLRQQLTDIWIALLDIVPSLMKSTPCKNDADARLKAIMRYIHTHYSENITVDQLAKEARVSKRSCYRLFRENLRQSPLEYMTEYRLKKAYQQLTQTDIPLTQIAYNCGLGSSSYFGKLFKARYHYTPVQFRKDWHNSDN